METLRQTTIKTRISDIVTGNFVRKEGLEPSFVVTNSNQRISRTKLLGTIVDKFISEEGNYSSITVDDDSDSIRIKAFREDTNIFNDFNLGDVVVVIGKVREYNGENYVIPEIVKKTVDPDHESLHKLEVLKNLLNQRKITKIIKKEFEKFSDVQELKKYLNKKYKIDPALVEPVLETITIEEKTKEKDYKPLVLETMDKLDEGEGAEIKKLIKECKLSPSTFEQVINELLSEGICYEPKPGVLKKV